MNQYKYKGFLIDIINEPTYKYGSADNTFNYSTHFFADGAEEYPTSKHGIKIWKDEELIDNCILIGSGGATGIQSSSSLIDDNRLLICCCDTVFSLTVPDLVLNWQVQADQATCFQIFKLEDDYLVHGELETTRIDKEGLIKWKFGGADIFVSMEGEEEFILGKDHIVLTDFCKTKYKIDFNGKLIK